MTVTGVDDDVADGDQSYTIALAAAESGDANYSGLDPADVSASNTDDESASLSIPENGMVKVPDDGTSGMLAGVTVEFPGDLDDRANATVKFAVVPDEMVPQGGPRGYSSGDLVVDITLEGTALSSGQRVTVCLPSENQERRVYRYDESMAQWVALPEPEDGSPEGMVCGETERFSLFTTGSVPDDQTKGWLARFGRTVATHVVEAVGTRLTAGTGAEQASWMVGDLMSRNGRTILSGSSFVLPLGSDGTQRWTAWGRGAYTEFDGEEGGAELDGEVVTGTVGVDWSRGRWLAGLALSHSEGDGDTRDTTDDVRRDLEVSLSSVHPYLRYETGEGLSLWGLLGYGEGDLERRSDGGASEVDLEMRMGAFGVQGQLGVWRGMEFSLKSDAFAMRMEADEEDDIPEVEADASRVRVLLEGAGHHPLESGGMLAPTLEAGLRYDEGDAEEGVGVEVGAGLHYADGQGRMTAQVEVRGLMVHEESDYDEWGVSGMVRLAPRQSGRGLSLHLGSSYGAAGSTTEQLWSQRDLAGLVKEEESILGERWEAELGYGLNGPGGRGVLTPYIGYERETGESAWRLGGHLEIGEEELHVGFEGTLRDSENGSESELKLHISGRW